jgi:beta-1,4-mannosyltransferase
LPHDRKESPVDRVAAKLLARACHVLFAHDESHVPRATAALGPCAHPIHVVQHGSYVGCYPAGRPPAAVREELGLPAHAFVFLAFGTLRRYKALDLVLEAFLSLRDPSVRLVVAGDPEDEGVAAAVAAAASHDGRIVPLLGAVPDQSVAELFAACDAAVLGRADGWTSGSLILALSFGVPVVAAAMPAYRALLDEGQAGWLFRPSDVESLRAALEEAARDHGRARRRGGAALAKARSLEWSHAAEVTARRLRGA